MNSATPSFFDRADAEHLLAFADHAAIAIENTRLYNQAQQEIAERMRAEEELRKHRDHLEELVAERTVELGKAVTEARQLNEQLEQEIIERERLIVDLKAFSHTVAHDLKSPLSLITAYSQLLWETLSERAGSKHPDDIELAKFAQIIDQTGYKLAHIIDEILLLTSVRHQDVVLRPLDMAAIVAQAEGRCTQAIIESGAEIIKPAAWPEAWGHAPWVEEVWANYISNAIKYGGRPPRLELGFSISEDPAIETVRFWVRDNGPGLSPEAQTQLFIQFTRLDESMSCHPRRHGG